MAGIPKSWNKQPQQAAAPRAPAQTVQRSATPYVRIAPRASRTAFYNPARIIDRSQIKIVDSIAAERQAAAEQRESSDERGDISIPISSTAKPLPPVAAKKPVDLKLLLGAAAAYFLLF